MLIYAFLPNCVEVGRWNNFVLKAFSDLDRFFCEGKSYVT